MPPSEKTKNNRSEEYDDCTYRVHPDQSITANDAEEHNDCTYRQVRGDLGSFFW
jgi:hypothetical protein